MLLDLLDLLDHCNRESSGSGYVAVLVFCRHADSGAAEREETSGRRISLGCNGAIDNVSGAQLARKVYSRALRPTLGCFALRDGNASRYGRNHRRRGVLHRYEKCDNGIRARAIGGRITYDGRFADWEG